MIQYEYFHSFFFSPKVELQELNRQYPISYQRVDKKNYSALIGGKFNGFLNILLLQKV